MNCDFESCHEAATFHFTGITARRVAYERYFCEPHAKPFFQDFRSRQYVGTGDRQMMPRAVCVEVELLAYHITRTEDPVCVYLHEVGGDRRLCFRTDGWAWWAIVWQIRQQAEGRRRTHAAWATTIRQLGGQLKHVLLGRREGEEWLDANLHIEKDGVLTEVGVRASDAVALSLTNGVPIFVVEAALDRFADRGPE